MNRLTFIKDLNKRTSENRKIGLFKCSCGKKVEKPMGRVKSGVIKSCGCIRGEKNIKHGALGTKEYKTWLGIKYRVFNKNNKDYIKYNKLGMSQNLAKNFLAFLAEVGMSPSKEHQIDRINNKIGYFEGNLRWATREEQGRNKSNSYRIFIGQDKFDTLEEAAKHFDVSIVTIVRWCDGYLDTRPKRGGYTKPKKGCRRELYY